MSSRWLFEAVLETVSPLHIGDGNWDQGFMEENAEGRNLLRVATASDRTAYIPGTTLKGRLRSWLEPDEGVPAFNDLFGTRMPEGGGDDPNAVGGLLEFADAMWTSSTTTSGQGWNGERKTCIAACVTIDRRTGAPAHQKLFSVEYVPGGTIFTVKIYARNLSEPQARLIAEMLEACNGGDATPQLGASTADGWGRFKLDRVTLKKLDGETLRNWARNPTGPVEQAMVEVVKESLPAPDGLALPGKRPTLDLNIRILFSGPFLSNDVSRAYQQPARDKWERMEGQAPNFVPLMDDQGQPILPVSSLRGALRSRAEKIWRTLNPEAPYYTVSPRADTDLDLPQVRETADVKHLDPPCLLFGAPGWGAPLAFGPIEVEQPGQLLDQDMVAIDRFTGGAADGAKFRSQFFYKPVMRTTLRVDAGALGVGGAGLSAKAWELLAFALQDLADGFITLGYGAAKGYGACTAEVTLADPRDLALAPESLRAVFQGGLRAHPLPAPSSAPAAAPPLLVDHCASGKFQPNYNFLRVEGAPQKCLTASQFDLGKIEEYSHDRISGYTGRMECFITAETPFFIGSSQKPDDEQTHGQPKRLNGFGLPGANGQNYPAIPATSLRGMVSSLYEAVTKSSLRVLKDQSYSYRNSSDQALTAIGMMVRRGGKWYMKPLCLPIQPNQIQKYRPYFSRPILRVYNGDEDAIFKPQFERQFPTWTPDDPQIVYQRIPTLEWNANFGEPSVQKRGSAILHQTASDDAQEVPCLVRTLGCSGEARKIPHGSAGKQGKKHELLIPFPEHAEFRVDDAGPADSSVIVVPDSVIQRFERLADEVTEEWDGPESGEDPRPYEPRATRPNRNQDRKLRIQAGDILYFDFDAGKVKEIAFSAIWRKEVPNRQGGASASIHDFFAQIDKDYLPLTDKRLDDRNASLTPAEMLFGFAEDRKGETRSARRPLAYKGRIRFGAGELVDPPEDPSKVLMEEVPLKALSSPKPPCPALYFWKDGNDWIGKSGLKCGYDHGKHLPRGRKVYLHHQSANQPWRSDPAAVRELFKQQVAVEPIRPKTQFRFEIFFENLAEMELATLYCVLRPSEAFRHKLGMGKPIGLGTVRIDLGRIDILWPKDRYTVDYLENPAKERFEQPITPAADLPMFSEAQKQLPSELLTVGGRAGTAVSYPLMKGLGLGMADAELKLFRWFVANQKEGHRAVLPPLGESDRLPTLAKQEEM